MSGHHSQVKKTMSEQLQVSSHQPDLIPCPRTQRRAPSTPPLPLRSLQLIVKQPEVPAVLRRKVKGHVSGIRDSWPGAGPNPRISHRSLTPPSWSQPNIEAWSRTYNKPQLHMVPSAHLSAPSQNPQHPASPHPHWSVPVRVPPNRWGSEATLMSLLLFCHR